MGADIFEVIKERTKTAEFESRLISEDMLLRMLEASHLAPTGAGKPRSREYVLVQNRGTLDALSRTHEFVKWLSTATAAVVFVGNPKESRYWLEDCCVAAEHLWLSATALGLGACWGALFQMDDPSESKRREDHVREILGIPPNLRPAAVIGLGYSKGTRQRPKRAELKEVLHRERW